MTPEEIINTYFAAMRRGPDGLADLVSLFTDQALYHEPFVDPGTPAKGREAIRARLTESWDQPPPDMELEVLTVEIAGGAAEVTWECRSPAFDQPVRGIDHYRFEDGLISELAVTIDSTPD